MMGAPGWNAASVHGLSGNELRSLAGDGIYCPAMATIIGAVFFQPTARWWERCDSQLEAIPEGKEEPTTEEFLSQMLDDFCCMEEEGGARMPWHKRRKLIAGVPGRL